MSSVDIWRDPSGRVTAYWDKGTIAQQDRGGIYLVFVAARIDEHTGFAHGTTHGPYKDEKGAVRAAKRYAKQLGN